MPATPITNAISGESLVGTEPQLLQQVDPGWRRRLNLFTGRALTDTALDSEQSYRAGLLATLGQSVSAGTVTGLAFTMDLSGVEPMLAIGPGYGISASGQDVVLNSPMKTSLSTLAVIDGVTGNAVINPITNAVVTFHDFVSETGNTTYAGILILQPVIAQVSGEALDTGTGPIVVSGNLGASCDQDPAEYAFEDWQIADAVQLVFLPWPAAAPALALPPLNPQATWRNRLAYTIFEAEAQLGPDDQLPWSMLGVPVAMVGFDPGVAWAATTAFTAGQFLTDSNGNLQQVQTAGTSGSAAPSAWSTALGGTTTDGSVTWVNIGPGWKPLFADCSAVVRAGGLPRSRYVLPSQPAPLLAWQAKAPFSAGSFILDSNDNVQVVQTAGTTGGPPPTWKTAFGQTTQDGSVVWINNGPGSWQPNTAFAAGQFLYDSNSNLQHVVTPGTSGSTEPDWNGIYLPTEDGSITWINSGSGNPPIVQPSLAQARINQLSEQLSQALTQQTSFTTLADLFSTLPPSGILPAASLKFGSQQAVWFPPNWSVSAAPVYLEELETVLETGMLEAPIAAETVAPSNAALLEPVEVLVPLPDSVYDPDILVQETVAPAFQEAVNQASEARNLTLQQLETVTQEVNTLYAALGPNVPANPSLVDPNAGLTPDEIQGRKAPPPYTPAANETFGTLLQTTWLPNTVYSTVLVVIDGNGTIQVATNKGGTSGATPPNWNTTAGQTTTDGIVWLAAGNASWQANTAYLAGQAILDSNKNIQAVVTGGTSGGTAPTFNATAGQNTTDNGVTWINLGNATWAASTPYTAGQAIIDANGQIQVAQVGGISGASAPAWNEGANATTSDNPVVWMNNGAWAWQPNTSYVAGQFVVDPGGFMQTVLIAGTSASAAPATWTESAGGKTSDGIVWQAGGNAQWQADSVYNAGQVILDNTGNIQMVQTAGISGDSVPAWTANLTQDSEVIWQSLGKSTWQPNTAFASGRAVIDSSGAIQLVQVAGVSGAQAPSWNEGANATTVDASVTWINSGSLTWQTGSQYNAGQIIIDPNGNLQLAQTTGQAGKNAPIWNVEPGGTTSDGAVTWLNLPFVSTDLAQLQAVAAQAPYNSLITASDLSDLGNYGLQYLINSINARISQANDLLDTAFLTSQTDIYRFRQNILGSTAASSLATSPVLANIATGETSTATATNLQDYVSTIIPPAGTAAPTYTPITNPVRIPVMPVFSLTATKFTASTSAASPAASLRSRAIIGQLPTGPIRQTPVEKLPTSGLVGGTVIRQPVSGTILNEPVLSGSAKPTELSPVALSTLHEASTGVLHITTTAPGAAKLLTSPSQIIAPGQNANATSTDITSQSPLAGAQANIRTLTIAERLAQSPSQEAMFYAISDRLTFMQSLATLETNTGFFADDLPVMVDGPAPAATGTAPAPAAFPAVTQPFSNWLSATGGPPLVSAIQNPYVPSDASEATLFSVGIRVVEQHVILLRALEARVQQYTDFVGLCTTALNNIQADVQQAGVYTTQLQNNLLQNRQNVAFTTALLSDETQRVAAVMAQRNQILSAVQLVAYTRARTLEASDTTPSRQLVPANVASPVPACLQQSVSIPPELREIVGMLREAPVTWLPSVSLQVSNLDRPTVLQQLGLSAVSRATQQLTMPLLPSSAEGEPGVYAPAISKVYSANQQVFRGYQMQRVSFQPSALPSLSWSLQVATMQGVAAVNDVIASDGVYTEVTNAVSRLIQQISSVATCLYTRAGVELPVDRLAWAEYLSGPGISAQLQSLAILPNWNQLAYTDRQQMQLLVDWLFLQIDTTNSSATAFMSDVVRTAILLASDDPVDNIIPANIVVRTLPTVGGVVSLNLPSDRISSGMFVNLYSGATLAARGVVSDLDSQSVTATVTDVFQQGRYLETSDVAHVTAQTPQAVALRPLFMKS